MKTKVCSIVMVVALVFSLCLSASASEITPQWDNRNSCLPTLSFSGSKAICSATITAADSTAKINATMTLYRINANGSRTQVASWSGLSGTGRLTASRSHSPVTSKSTYHLVLSGTIAGESFSTYDSATCP